jgi:multicomponent Na+:H+ antiporter subunit G
MISYAVLVLVVIGLLFNLLAVIGLLRFPDPYTRLHAGTKCTTFGTIFICLSVIVYSIVQSCDGAAGCGQFSLHALVALIAILLTNPTGAHAISRAAHRSGVLPAKAVVDKLKKR